MPEPLSKISKYDDDISDSELERDLRVADALRREVDTAENKARRKRILYLDQVREVHRKSTMLVRQTPPSSIVDEWKDRFRSVWLSIPRAETDLRTSLAVVHGLVERADAGTLDSAKEWLQHVYEHLASAQFVPAHELERAALKLGCGLPVLDFERLPTSASALFGVVEEVEDGEARVWMSIPEGETDPTAPIWEACTVPAVDLPIEYAIPGVWVAWVDRTYDCDGAAVQKGRFEPASSLVTIKPRPSPLVQTSGLMEAG